MPHKGDAEDFDRLQELGFKFDSRNEYNEQPSSGSVIGGRRGQQEYGLTEGPAVADIEEEEESEIMPDQIIQASDLLPVDEAGPYGGVSEWSTKKSRPSSGSADNKNGSSSQTGRK